MKYFFIVFIGSGIGGVSRYISQTWMGKVMPSAFPLGTFAVNIVGCFLMGIFYALAEKQNMMSAEWRLALTTGFCGGFTTFSAFALENIMLIKNGNYLYFSLYTIGSVLLGFFGVIAGVALSKIIL